MRSAPLSVAAPFEMAQAGTTLALLAWETQLVMTMRILGMAGVWSVVPSENARMVSEKGPAWAEATQAAAGAALAGKRPDEVAAAWAAPLRRHTSANARRLGRRGFKLR